MSIESNTSNAIFGKFNALLEQYGINPCTLCGELHNDDKSSTYIFRITSGDGMGHPKFSKIIQDLGMTDLQLKGEAEEIYAALDNALQKAPKIRRR